MSSRQRKEGSSRAIAPMPTQEPVARSAASGYVGVGISGSRANVGSRNILLWLIAIVGALALVWAGMLLFAPSKLPSLLRVGAGAGTPAQYSPEGRISFVRVPEDGKTHDLFVVNPDGTNQQQVTHDIFVQGTHVWSPDGRRMIVQADVNGVSTVVRLAIGPDNKATEAVQLTADVKADSGLPAWSPDGTLIAFQSKREGGDYQVFVMDTNGNNKRRLSDGKGYAGQPAWSPDGKNIAYIASDKADPGVAKEIYVVPVSGGAPKQLTKLGKDLSRPVWSPDGKQIMYMQNLGDRSHTVFVMNADGTDARSLIQYNGGTPPEFSPDGQKVVYSAIDYSVTPPSGTDVLTIPASGGQPANLTPLSSEDYAPIWSPDGKKLAWANGQGGPYKIAVAGADGSNPKLVSTGNGTDGQPSWGEVVK